MHCTQTMQNYYQISLFLILLFVIGAKSFTDYSLESAKILNETSRIPGYGNVTLKRSSHNYPQIFADFEVTDDLKNYDGEVKMYYSPLGNQHYVLLPFKLYRQPVCKILNNEYRNRLMEGLRNYCNLPFSEDENVDLCDLMPLGQYYCHNYSPDVTTYRSALPTGRYRAIFLFYKKNENIVCKSFEFLALFT